MRLRIQRDHKARSHDQCRAVASWSRATRKNRDNVLEKARRGRFAQRRGTTTP